MSNPVQQPSLGRVVIYTLTELDKTLFSNNGASECPATIVRVWDNGMVNLRLQNDGEGSPWRTSIHQGDQPGQWNWPKFVPPKIAEGTHR
jgi:hypothetical protein